jgi:hypothetical protein
MKFAFCGASTLTQEEERALFENFRAYNLSSLPLFPQKKKKVSMDNPSTFSSVIMHEFLYAGLLVKSQLKI